MEYWIPAVVGLAMTTMCASLIAVMVVADRMRELRSDLERERERGCPRDERQEREGEGGGHGRLLLILGDVIGLTDPLPGDDGMQPLTDAEIDAWEDIEAQEEY